MIITKKAIEIHESFFKKINLYGRKMLFFKK